MDESNLIPEPPIIGKVTHSTIELLWDKKEPLEKYNHKKSYIKNLKYIVQEDELKGLETKGYGTVYSGFAKSNTFIGLEPRTIYRYRIKYKLNNKETIWSLPVEVSTTKRPPSSEDIIKAVTSNDPGKLHKLLQDLPKELVDAPDRYGNSPLMIAASKGFIMSVQTLLENNADIRYQNTSGRNALLAACYNGQFPIVRMLVEHGASRHCSDKAGCTPLHASIDGRNVEMTKWLLNNDFQVDLKNVISGWTPLMRLASTNGDIRIARLLIRHGANINLSDNNRTTILMKAIMNRHRDLIELILQKGAKVDVSNVHGNTALDMARSSGDLEIIKIVEEYCKKFKKQVFKEEKEEKTSTLILSA